MLHKIDKRIGVVSMVVKQDWITMCHGAKDQCTFITKGLINEVNKRFPTQELMNDIGII
jgi:hypothetical protein